MPQAFVKKMAKKHGVSVKTAESKWEEAKKSAKSQGKADNYAYITSIFERMMGESARSISTDDSCADAEGYEDDTSHIFNTDSLEHTQGSLLRLKRRVLARLQGTLSGFYSCLSVHPRSQVNLRELVADAPFDTETGNYLHCTTIYSPDTFVTRQDLLRHLDWCAQYEAERPNIMGVVMGATFFAGDDGTGALVLAVHCDEAVELHEHWKSEGFVHTFPEFVPHITVSSDVPEADALLYMENLNSHLADRRLIVKFGMSNVDYIGAK